MGAAGCAAGTGASLQPASSVSTRKAHAESAVMDVCFTMVPEKCER
jgi:hypothetical protein